MAPFKVAIIGGGMTGLTAALHLDRLGIDFVLLEAYDDLTPEVGASLALYPNFQRVVDQLGVLDEVHRESSEIAHISCHDIDGNLKYQHDVLDQLHEATGVYGIRTWTRAQLLKVLYGNTSESGKSKMLTGQRVSRIEQLPNDEGVRVHVEGGKTHDVDLVIGADGTHSIVRSEMWRMAEEDKSQVFKNDKGEDSNTQFACVFGLSTKTGDLQKDVAYQVSGKDMTIGVFGGAKGEALWFVFFQADAERSKQRGLGAPRFTPEEGLEICQKYSGAKLTDKTNFGDVFANRHRITTQACPNHCLKRWHYNRLICLGDSVAKTNPILAQGGAQGAEGAVMLVDQIYEALQQGDGKTNLSSTDIDIILTRVNKARYARVSAAVNKSQQIIQISAWSNWLFRFVGKYVTPLLPTWIFVAQALGQWKGSYVSTSLPAATGPAKTESDATAGAKAVDGASDSE